MGNKRLKKRAYSLKGLGRRGLSMLMAMVMTLSLVQISAFAIDGEESDTLKPQAVTDKNKHGITLSKTAERVGDTEWQVTVKADIGETPIKQQPLDVVFVLDKSGSMAWCSSEDHDQGFHVHTEECYERVGNKHVKTYTDPFGNERVWEAHPEEEYDWLPTIKSYYYETVGKTWGFDYSKCSDYELVCTKKETMHHIENGASSCKYWQDGEWHDYEPDRLSAAKSAMSTLAGKLPNGANVSYVVFSDDADAVPSYWYPDMDHVTAQGGTNIMAGVDKGIDLLNQNHSTATKKVLVLLSDGEDDNGIYSSDKLRNFNGDVYTVGFALDNQNLKGMIKGDGKYIYAKNAEALNSAFTELSTRIAAMIVDPMGDEVTYVSGSAQDKGTTQGIITQDGNTLRWIPANQTEFNKSTIEYTYNVKLTPSEEAGDYTDIKLNNTTYLQYGVEQNGNKTAYTANFPIPAGYYKVSTLTEKFVDKDGKDISQYVEKPHTFFQSAVTDNIEMNGDTYLDVNAPAKTLDTNDEHVKYLYVSSTLDEEDYAYTEDEGNYVDGSLNVTDEAKAHELVHVYERATVNSVEYKYAGDVPEDATELTDGYAKTWYPTGTENIEVQPDAESDMYTFSGWEKVRGEAEIKTDENGKKTFDLVLDEDNRIESGDVLFEGSWTIKPSYRVVANYYTRIDGAFDPDKPDNTDGPISLTSGVNDDDVIYVDEDENGEYTIKSDDYSK